MSEITDTHQGFVLVQAPFEQVEAALIGGARALLGPLSVVSGRRLRACEIQDAANARLRGATWAMALPGCFLLEARPGYCLIDVTFNEGIAKTLSFLLPEAYVLRLDSWSEGKVRSVNRAVVFHNGRALRAVAATKGTEKTGWDWEEAGPVMPWEDPMVYGARQISARLTRAEIYAMARRFGIDIEATLATPEGRSATIEFLSDYDPDASELETLDHMDLSQRAVSAGHGDSLNLERIDRDGAMRVIAEMERSPAAG